MGLIILQTSDVRSQRKRHSTAPKGASSKTKYSINNVRHPTQDPSLVTTSNVPLQLGPRNRRYQNIAWTRGQHPVAHTQSIEHSSINTSDHANVKSTSLMDAQQQHRHMTQPTNMSVRPIYNPSVYRINRIKPPNTASTSQKTIDNPNSAQEHKSIDSKPQTLGKYKWLSS